MIHEKKSVCGLDRTMNRMAFAMCNTVLVSKTGLSKQLFDTTKQIRITVNDEIYSDCNTHHNIVTYPIK